jgi:hypothetical protein
MDTNETIDYGVCRLAVISVRQAPAFSATQISQLLFGDHYQVLRKSENEEWLYIRVHFDATEGWVEAEQHHTILKDYYEQINLANFKITTDLTSNLLYKKSPLTILMGSIVPISNSELFKMEEQFAFNGEAKSLGQKRDAEFIKAIALKYLNAPHMPGGRNPFGIDAAGLIQMVFKIAGYVLPHSIAQQQGAGKKVKSWNDGRAGDLAFFTRQSKEVTHVGLLLGDEKILHVDGKVRIDHLMEEGILRSDTRIYTHTLKEIRRIVST